MMDFSTLAIFLAWYVENISQVFCCIVNCQSYRLTHIQSVTHFSLIFFRGLLKMLCHSLKISMFRRITKLKIFCDDDSHLTKKLNNMNLFLYFVFRLSNEIYCTMMCRQLYPVFLIV